MAELRDHTAGRTYDAVVVGAGPNGLAAALTLARAGQSVLVLEAAATVGGGARTAELTLPGFRHDVCSAIHPLGIGSPFFRTVPLSEHGVEWIQPPFAAAHPLDDGSAGVLAQSLDETARTLGTDGKAWRWLFGPLAERWDTLASDLLAPILHVPRHPVALARFGLRALWPAATLARTLFRTERARALFAGLAAHAIMPLEHPLTAAFGLVLGMSGHAVGWPLPRRGAQTIADALAALVRAHGGEIVTNAPVTSLGERPAARAVLLDVTPRQMLAIAGDRLQGRYRRRLERYRYGPGVFKVDAALDGPIPWSAGECAQAGTVHVGGTLDEIAAAEAAVWRGEHPERPFVLVAQQSLFDATRAPAGKHTLWAYCHVPNGSTIDMTGRILAQIERFAPGLCDRILAVATHGPAALESYDANYVGGDIAGGAQGMDQMFGRPAWRLDPYATPSRGLYLCSASTPPGGGVHGMCGYLAAQAALRDLRSRR
jgi:phytoene dehydrogenase-like protein